MNTIHIICASRNLNRLRLYMSKSVICFISAFRDGLDVKENLQRQNDLAKKLQDGRLGWITLEGHWDEEIDGVVQSSVEKTFAVINNSRYGVLSLGEFIDIMVNAASAYDQSAILIVVPTCDGDYIDSNGNSLVPGHGYYYSKYSSWSSPDDKGVFSTSAVEEWEDGGVGSRGRGYSKIKNDEFKFAHKNNVSAGWVVSSFEFSEAGFFKVFYLGHEYIMSSVHRLRNDPNYFRWSSAVYDWSTIHIICASRNLNRLRLYMSKSVICFISAFRSQYSLEENLRRQERLSKQLLGLGLGWVTLDGRWEVVSEDGDMKEEGVEKTFAVINNSRFCSMSTGEFIDVMVNAAVAYDQYAVLVSVPSGEQVDLKDSFGNTLRSGHGYYYYPGSPRLSSPEDKGVFSVSTVGEWEKNDDGTSGRGYSRIKDKEFKFDNSGPIESGLLVSSFGMAAVVPKYLSEVQGVKNNVELLRSGYDYFGESFPMGDVPGTISTKPKRFGVGLSLPGLMDRGVN